MDPYEHITHMETIKHETQRLMGQLEGLLDQIEDSQDDYQTLVSYYCSEQRRQDLEDDERGLIPKTLCRGVLSEDEIDDLMADCHELGLRMIELGLSLIKTRA